MATPFPSLFPQLMPEPTSYYRGVDTAARIRSRNAVVFMRDAKTKLQQSHLSNLSHHRHVLVFVLKTSGVVSVEGSRLPLKAGEALLVLPYQFHHYMELEEDSLRWLFFTFEVEGADEPLAGLDHRVLRPDKWSLQLMGRVVALWSEADRPGRAAELLTHLDHLLLRLTLAAEPDSKPRRMAEAAAGSWGAQAESLVVQSLRQGWTIGQMAERMNVSERHFRNRFKAATGVSIRGYRANIQIHRALAAMKESHLSIGQVAELSGFRSQAVFTRFFQRETGRSPTQCRRLLQTGGLDEIFPRSDPAGLDDASRTQPQSLYPPD